MPDQQQTIDVDWGRNWHASLANKITGAILWGIMLVSVTAAVVIQSGTRQNIERDLQSLADNQTFNINHALWNSTLSEEIIRSVLDEHLNRETFDAVEFDSPLYKISIGSPSVDDTFIERPLILRESTQSSRYQTFTIRYFHAPMEKLVRESRQRALFYVGLPLLLFGILLASIINIIVVQPIKEMVNATHKVCKGDMSIRLNNDRIDEFGELQKFFNRMLNQLQDSHIELRGAFTRAEMANKAKSAFLANMSHELRTPLNAIIGYTDLVRDSLEHAGVDECKSDTDKIIKAAHHLLNLINEVLDLTKIESGKMELHLEEFSLSGTIDDVVTATKAIVDSNHNTLMTYYKDELGIANSDQTKIHQILLNLLSNAAKFTQNGDIIVLAERFERNDSDWFRIAVKDTGIGMTEEQTNRVFNDFVQADSGTTKRFGGTGLGLSITRRLCELLGGRILVQSEPNKGSVFVIELPLDTGEFLCPIN